MREDILELLAQGPSSFAALYSYLIRVCKHKTKVLHLLELLTDMRSRGLVEMRLIDEKTFRSVTENDWVRVRGEYQEWLSPLTPEELTIDATSLDEVGLWVMLGTAAQRESQITPGDMKSEGSGDSVWKLDDIAHAQTIVVHADSEIAAEKALRQWILHRDRGIELIPESRRIEPVGAPGLGVRVTCHYRIVSKT